MAHKIDRAAAAPPAASRDKGTAGDEDLAILHPQRDVFLAGRRLVVREYGFIEGLKLRATAQPFLDALYALSGGHGRPPSFTEVESLLADHLDCVIALIAQAADVEAEWIAALNDEDGYRLMQEWWLANSGFFIRRVVQRLATARAVAALPGGRASTTRSSEPDTVARPRISDASPPAS